MILNPDCVRDILLTVESKEFGAIITLNNLMDDLPQYSESELHYTCLKMSEGNLLDILPVKCLGSNMPGIKYINSITYYGHEFLENIKSDTAWNKTKEIAKTVGSYSLSTLGTIASNVITELINKHL